MAKIETEAQEQAATKSAAPASSTKKTVMTEPQMSFDQYLQNVDPNIHTYTRAYLRPQYRVILKTRDEWAAELKPYLGT